ncbi:AAA family ATPase [Butyrivibrio sp. CB08]|uniref:ATP-binding protein n=1 Tax=Butyrivibrio sp. CB08 TaxID=2364879 RepID=UPI000EA91BF5|nr:AAA family ATPase [Butyrivibrio sp. CB08]RKM61388.1 AAA family ATPase [Butyrivibrio sp. CB08]
MNIDQAKEEVKNAVRAYLSKDETGQYEIPVERQRPILLMGPPGIGKTAIMEQIAHDLGINLVAYTITHHTRQSAIGLPMIATKSYGGKEYSVTEYTMSEIVASVYDQIEKSGVKEGILFLDEINCVSETLAPTMLQFLQYKTFGSHRIPDGFIIVTAGNPARFNKSVRDFDIVTLDRVRQINIEEDFDAWKNYAYKVGIHGAILAYLEIKKDNFYSIKTDVDGRSFVTARGWEDLSRVMKVHEKLGIPVDENLCSQYLQNHDIARDFATYYELYLRYNEVYKIPDILEGRFPEDKESLRKGSFDEKLSIIGLLTDALMGEFRDFARQQAVQKTLFEIIKEVAAGDGDSSFAARRKQLLDDVASRKEAGMIDRDSEKSLLMAADALSECEKLSADEAKKWFTNREDERQAKIKKTGEHLSNSFAFLEETFGDSEALTGSQEMVIFLTELSSAYHSLKFVRETGNEAYYKYNKLLLLSDRKKELQDLAQKLVF